MSSRPRFFALTAALLLPASASPYDAGALRGDLLPLPCYATSGARENQRFQEAAVNRYRLYDFYVRQAEYYLANPAERTAILPPYPGLDGGRRGHWGATNERETSAFAREDGPELTAISSRGAEGVFHLLSGPREDPAVIVFDGIAGRLKSVHPRARLSVPGHPFGLKIDRFGFNLDLAGDASLEGKNSGWSREEGKAAWFAGYHVDGDSVVIRSEIGADLLLERPATESFPEDSGRCLRRDFEFPAGLSEPTEFALPQAAGGAEGPVNLQVEEGSGAWWVEASSGGITAIHQIRGIGAMAFQVAGERVRIGSAAVASRLVVRSWAGPVKEASAARLAMAALAQAGSGEAPSSCLKGGPTRFPQTVSVSGVLDADPAARGGAYVIDDIPVPSDNPYHAPMTLSGLAFAADGVAYVSTLVGDVWQVRGLEGDLRQVEWKRYAAGLDLPMGVAVVDGVPYVSARHFIFRLVDLNGDGEADLYERFSRPDLPASECGRDLQRDEAGNFYFNTVSGIYQLSADGRGLRRIGEGSRNPLGIGVRGDGLVLSDSSEGNDNNGTCTIYEAAHPDNAASTAKGRRILYLPRGVDNSPGSRIFLNEPRFGPLGHGLLGTSFGANGWYYLLREKAGDTPQAAIVPLPGQFSSGTCRIAVQPKDGQLFVAGLDGWGDYAVTEGCLHRIRYTGKACTTLNGWAAYRNGILLRFDHAVAPGDQPWFVQQWNYVDSEKTYGSPEYSVKSPDSIGHDQLEVRAVHLLEDGHAVFLELPDLLPSMCLQVHGRLRESGGRPLPVDAYLTLNRLAGDHPAAPAAASGKAELLKVPEREQNGNTYQNLVTHFDRLAGRDSAARPVGPEAARPGNGETIGFGWIRSQLIERQCITCHAPGTQHDFSSYEGLMKKVDPDHPAKSAILGMIDTKSMPPYPLPTVSPSMRQALLEWIQAGAPR